MASSSAMKANAALLLVASLFPLLITFILRAFGVAVGLWDLLLLEAVVFAYFKDNIVLIFSSDAAGAPARASLPESSPSSEGTEEVGAAGDELSPAAKAAMPSGALPTDERYATLVKETLDAFLKMEKDNDPNVWTQALEQPGLRVFQDKGSADRYKVITHLSNSPLTCFSLLCDVERRKEWDEMCAEARIVEKIDPFTNVVYVRTKGMMLFKSRDIVLLSHRTVLPNGDLVSITRSVEHPGAPVSSSYVRMEGGIAGMICRPLAGGKCEVFQILDGDLKGNVPAAVRSFILNKMLPGTTAALDSKVKALPMIDRPLRRAAAASGAAHSSDLGERIDSLNEALNRLEKRSPATSASNLLTKVRAGLQWATPFMLGVIYLIVLLRFFARRRK